MKRTYNSPPVYASSAMTEIIDGLPKIAKSDARVIITGETGVGKELLARYIHRISPRREHNFVTVNCPAINESLLESELFGHARGSFTGAVADKRGKLEEADGGTALLDEITIMPLKMQGLLLRFLETGELEKVGYIGPKKQVDVRIISATNENIVELIRNGEFRRQLGLQD